MKIAVTYENGQVFQHFGHCENFKIYDVNDGMITDSQGGCPGHGAVPGGQRGGQRPWRSGRIPEGQGRGYSDLRRHRWWRKSGSG